MDTYQKHYDILNSEQKKAVDTLDGPLLVLAGPGTGKTQLLSVRAANIIRQKKCSPENILI
ncbi:MAG: UvrD-helicase domain-containing protein, partial [Candidatus Omnitrophica bacterium]|nr:UvrD-helicase domain-containing protein [Candidatus Omnitrophota bacterium]